MPSGMTNIPSSTGGIAETAGTRAQAASANGASRAARRESFNKAEGSDTVGALTAEVP